MTDHNPKILISGSAGFLGLCLSRKLLEKGETHLRCLVRSVSTIDRLENLKSAFPGARVEILQGNLLNSKNAEEAVKGIDVVYHCAAEMIAPIAAMCMNTVVATRNLLEAIVKEGRIKRFVHVSSFAVYGTAPLQRRAVVSEETLLEPNPKKRDDAYTYTKLKQEQLVWKYKERYGLPVVVVRPGVVYGPGGAQISSRVGKTLLGYFLNIGRRNLLPLSYVDNCADTIILAGTVPNIEGEVFNVHDSDLITCDQFLRRYRERVRRMKCIRTPYSIFWLFSWLVDRYSRYSKRQIPPALNPYKTASIWKGTRFDNAKIIKVLGWRQGVSTKEGLERHFEHCRRINAGQIN
jgi:nucleoside-diphosphate-sugar epimerase